MMRLNRILNQLFVSINYEFFNFNVIKQKKILKILTTVLNKKYFVIFII